MDYVVVFFSSLKKRLHTIWVHVNILRYTQSSDNYGIHLLRHMSLILTLFLSGHGTSCVQSGLLILKENIDIRINKLI